MTVDYIIKKGGHRDLHRIYPMLAFDFRPFERFRELTFQAALLGGDAELLLLKNAAGVECGYAILFTRSLYQYVLLAFIAVYPPFRGQGAGGAFLDLIRARYAEKQGILLEVTEHDDPGETERLKGIYGARGWRLVPCIYRLGGHDAVVMNLPLRGPADISAAVTLIVNDIYRSILPDRRAAEYAWIRRP